MEPIEDFLQALATDAPPGRELLPLSYPQESLVKAYAKMTDLGTQHLCLARRLTGGVDVRNIEAALNLLVIRHPALRTRYLSNRAGELYAEIEGPWSVSLASHDFSQWPENSREDQIRACISTLRAARFDLEAGRLMRAAVARLSEKEHVLAIVLHHSIVDLWSCNVLLRDLLVIHASLAKGAVPRLPPLLVKYTDHIKATRGWIHSERGREQLAYWRSVLLDVKNPFALPADAHADPLPAPLEGSAEQLRLDAPTLARLRKLARAERTTVQVIVLAAYAAALTAWNAANVALIAVAHFGRPTRELWDLVGCFIQCWVLRADVSAGMSFRDLVRHVAGRWAQAQRNIQFPFTPLKAQIAQRAQENPLLHITFNYRPHTIVAGGAAGEPRVSPFDLGPQPSTLDEGRGEKLNFTAFELEDHIEGTVRYSPARFRRATVRAFVARVTSLLEDSTRDPAFVEPMATTRLLPRI